MFKIPMLLALGALGACAPTTPDSPDPPATVDVTVDATAKPAPDGGTEFAVSTSKDGTSVDLKVDAKKK